MFSVCCTSLFILYSLVRLELLITNKNQYISTYSIDIKENDSLDLTKYNFNIAFGVRNYNTKKSRHDPNFVEFFPHFKIQDKTGKVKIIPIAFNKCNETDFKKFYKVQKYQAEVLE